MNTTTGIARLTKDPELTTLTTRNGGKEVSKLTLRLAERKSRPRGENTTNFYDAEVFGPYAEHLAKTLRKGSRIGYRGELDHQTWTKDGEKRSRYVLNLDQVEFADNKPADAGAGGDADSYDGPEPVGAGTGAYTDPEF